MVACRFKYMVKICKCPCHRIKDALCGIDSCCFEAGKLFNLKRILWLGESVEIRPLKDIFTLEPL